MPGWRSWPAPSMQRSRSEANADRRDRTRPHGRQHLSPPDEGGAPLRGVRRQRQAARGAGEGRCHSRRVARGDGEGARGKAARRLADAAGRPDHRGNGRDVSAACSSADDIIIDGGNSFYKDDIRRAKKLAEKRIRYVDCGTSGGVWGIERGYCMMIGGPKEAVDHLDPIFAALAPGLGDIPRTPGRDRATRGPSAATFMPARPAPGISSRWCITASSTD